MTCRDLALALALGAAVIVGLPAAPVLAQTTDAGAPPAAAPSPAPATESPPPPPPENHPLPDPIAGRIKYLHDRLRITPAQEPLWARVAEVMRENAKTLAPFIKDRVQSAEHGSAIETLKSYEKLGAAQLEDLKTFIDAFQALYNGLSAAQKKIADSIFRLGPLAMIGAIPESAEALIAPEYAPPIPGYASAPPSYPGYAYAAPYGYYPDYYGPLLWGAPLGVSPFFLHRHFFFHGPFVHAPFHAFHHR